MSLSKPVKAIAIVAAAYLGVAGIVAAVWGYCSYRSGQMEEETRTVFLYEATKDEEGAGKILESVPPVEVTLNLRTHHYFWFKTDYSAIVDIEDDRLYLNYHMEIDETIRESRRKAASVTEGIIHIKGTSDPESPFAYMTSQHIPAPEVTMAWLYMKEDWSLVYMQYDDQPRRRDETYKGTARSLIGPADSVEQAREQLVRAGQVGLWDHAAL